MSNLLKIWIAIIALGGLMIMVHIKELNTESASDHLMNEEVSLQTINKLSELLQIKNSTLEVFLEENDQHSIETYSNQLFLSLYTHQEIKSQKITP